MRCAHLTEFRSERKCRIMLACLVAFLSPGRRPPSLCLCLKGSRGTGFAAKPYHPLCSRRQVLQRDHRSSVAWIDEQVLQRNRTISSPLHGCSLLLVCSRVFACRCECIVLVSENSFFPSQTEFRQALRQNNWPLTVGLLVRE